MVETTAGSSSRIEGIRRRAVAALLLSAVALSAVMLVFAADVDVASLAEAMTASSAAKNATDASLAEAMTASSAAKNATDASLLALMSIATATSGSNVTEISVPPFAITSDGALFGGAYDAIALQLNFTCNGTLAAITSSEAFPKPVVEVYVNGSEWESFTANATHIEIASLSGSSSICIIFTSPPYYTIGPFTLTSDLPFNTTAYAPANGTWNAEAGELVFSPGVADVNITADRFPSTIAWYFIAWWDDPLDLSTADQPAITRVDGDYDLMQIPMYWHSPSSGAGYSVIVRFITLPLITGPAQMNVSEGDASLTDYTDTDGVLTLTGCGDIVLSSEGLPSGEFLITVNGEIWTDWSSNGTYITILNVPCPDAVVVIDFHLESEQSNPAGGGGGGGSGSTGGGGGGGGAGTGGGEESGGTGTEQPPDNALPPAVTNATQQFAGWANETFTFVPEEARTPVAVAAVIGMPAIAIWLLLMLLGIMSKGGGR